MYAWNGDAFIQFGIQVIGVTVIILWSVGICGIVFGILRIFGVLRVSEEAEKEGLDFDNGEPAYPMDPALILGSVGSAEDDSYSSANTF